tara:strand:- start:941 stop:1363 length:423 start_codon:yes stop_codon:yes gene_type:complete
MGKINSRNKGASFERDIASKINKYLDDMGDRFPKFRDIPRIKRNLEQYQEKELGDLCFPKHTLECKRYASGNWYKEDWWKQTVTASEKTNTIPVLIWKYNHQPIRVCIPMYVLTKRLKIRNDKTVVLTFENWLETLASVL